MPHRYNYPVMPDLFTGNERADIDTQLKKILEELIETADELKTFSRTGNHEDHVKLVEEFMDIDHAVEQGKRLLEAYGVDIDDAGKEVFRRNKKRKRYSTFARMPR